MTEIRITKMQGKKTGDYRVIFNDLELAKLICDILESNDMNSDEVKNSMKKMGIDRILQMQ